jgi:hypothetical protein
MGGLRPQIISRLSLQDSVQRAVRKLPKTAGNVGFAEYYIKEPDRCVSFIHMSMNPACLTACGCSNRESLTLGVQGSLAKLTWMAKTSPIKYVLPLRASSVHGSTGHVHAIVKGKGQHDQLFGRGLKAHIMSAWCN